MPRSSASLPNLESYEVEPGDSEKGERRETLKVRKPAKPIGINVWLFRNAIICLGGWGAIGSHFIPKTVQKLPGTYFLKNLLRWVIDI